MSITTTTTSSIDGIGNDIARHASITRRKSIYIKVDQSGNAITSNVSSSSISSSASSSYLQLPSFLTKKFMLEIVAGGASGGISRTVVAPLERVKVLLQVQELALSKNDNNKPYKGIIDALVRIPKEQGFVAYWRGNGVNCIRIIPNSAIKFATFDHFKRLTFPGGEDKYKNNYNEFLLRKLACGGLSGVATIVPIYPLDLARTRLTADVRSTRMYKGLFDCLKQTFHNEGFIGMYKGLGVSVFGIIPYLVGDFYFYIFLIFSFYQHAFIY